MTSVLYPSGEGSQSSGFGSNPSPSPSEWEGAGYGEVEYTNGGPLSSFTSSSSFSMPHASTPAAPSSSRKSSLQMAMEHKAEEWMPAMEVTMPGGSLTGGSSSSTSPATTSSPKFFPSQGKTARSSLIHRPQPTHPTTLPVRHPSLAEDGRFPPRDYACTPLHSGASLSLACYTTTPCQVTAAPLSTSSTSSSSTCALDAPGYGSTEEGWTTPTHYVPSHPSRPLGESSWKATEDLVRGHSSEAALLHLGVPRLETWPGRGRGRRREGRWNSRGEEDASAATSSSARRSGGLSSPGISIPYPVAVPVASRGTANEEKGIVGSASGSSSSSGSARGTLPFQRSGRYTGEGRRSIHGCSPPEGRARSGGPPPSPPPPPPSPTSTFPHRHPTSSNPTHPPPSPSPPLRLSSPLKSAPPSFPSPRERDAQKEEENLTGVSTPSYPPGVSWNVSPTMSTAPVFPTEQGMHEERRPLTHPLPLPPPPPPPYTPCNTNISPLIFQDKRGMGKKRSVKARVYPSGGGAAGPIGRVGCSTDMQRRPRPPFLKSVHIITEDHGNGEEKKGSAASSEELPPAPSRFPALSATRREEYLKRHQEEDSTDRKEKNVSEEKEGTADEDSFLPFFTSSSSSASSFYASVSGVWEEEARGRSKKEVLPLQGSLSGEENGAEIYLRNEKKHESDHHAEENEEKRRACQSRTEREVSSNTTATPRRSITPLRHENEEDHIRTRFYCGEHAIHAADGLPTLPPPPSLPEVHGSGHRGSMTHRRTPTGVPCGVDTRMMAEAKTELGSTVAPWTTCGGEEKEAMASPEVEGEGGAAGNPPPPPPLSNATPSSSPPSNPPYPSPNNSNNNSYTPNGSSNNNSKGSGGGNRRHRAPQGGGCCFWHVTVALQSFEGEQWALDFAEEDDDEESKEELTRGEEKTPEVMTNASMTSNTPGMATSLQKEVERAPLPQEGLAGSFPSLGLPSTLPLSMENITEEVEEGAAAPHFPTPSLERTFSLTFSNSISSLAKRKRRRLVVVAPPPPLPSYRGAGGETEDRGGILHSSGKRHAKRYATSPSHPTTISSSSSGSGGEGGHGHSHHHHKHRRDPPAATRRSNSTASSSSSSSSSSGAAGRVMGNENTTCTMATSPPAKGEAKTIPTTPRSISETTLSQELPTAGMLATATSSTPSTTTTESVAQGKELRETATTTTTPLRGEHPSDAPVPEMQPVVPSSPPFRSSSSRTKEGRTTWDTVLPDESSSPRNRRAGSRRTAESSGSRSRSSTSTDSSSSCTTSTSTSTSRSSSSSTSGGNPTSASSTSATSRKKAIFSENEPLCCSNDTRGNGSTLASSHPPSHVLPSSPHRPSASTTTSRMESEKKAGEPHHGHRRTGTTTTTTAMTLPAPLLSTTPTTSSSTMEHKRMRKWRHEVEARREWELLQQYVNTLNDPAFAAKSGHLLDRVVNIEFTTAPSPSQSNSLSSSLPTTSNTTAGTMRNGKSTTDGHPSLPPSTSTATRTGASTTASPSLPPPVPAPGSASSSSLSSSSSSSSSSTSTETPSSGIFRLKHPIQPLLQQVTQPALHVVFDHCHNSMILVYGATQEMKLFGVIGTPAQCGLLPFAIQGFMEQFLQQQNAAPSHGAGVIHGTRAAASGLAGGGGPAWTSGSSAASAVSSSSYSTTTTSTSPSCRSSISSGIPLSGLSEGMCGIVQESTTAAGVGDTSGIQRMGSGGSGGAPSVTSAVATSETPLPSSRASTVPSSQSSSGIFGASPPSSAASALLASTTPTPAGGGGAAGTAPGTSIPTTTSFPSHRFARVEATFIALGPSKVVDLLDVHNKDVELELKMGPPPTPSELEEEEGNGTSPTTTTTTPAAGAAAGTPSSTTTTTTTTTITLTTHSPPKMTTTTHPCTTEGTETLEQGPSLSGLSSSSTAIRGDSSEEEVKKGTTITTGGGGGLSHLLPSSSSRRSGPSMRSSPPSTGIMNPSLLSTTNTSNTAAVPSSASSSSGSSSSSSSSVGSGVPAPGSSSSQPSTDAFVRNASTVPCRTVNEALSVLDLGLDNFAVADATFLQSEGSSSLLFSLTAYTNTYRSATLHLLCLAEDLSAQSWFVSTVVARCKAMREDHEQSWASIQNIPFPHLLPHRVVRMLVPPLCFGNLFFSLLVCPYNYAMSINRLNRDLSLVQQGYRMLTIPQVTNVQSRTSFRPLPHPWEEKFKMDGQRYFHNTETGVNVKDDPRLPPRRRRREQVDAPPSRPSHGAPAPPPNMPMRTSSSMNTNSSGTRGTHEMPPSVPPDYPGSVTTASETMRQRAGLPSRSSMTESTRTFVEEADNSGVTPNWGTPEASGSGFTLDGGFISADGKGPATPMRREGVEGGVPRHHTSTIPSSTMNSVTNGVIGMVERGMMSHGSNNNSASNGSGGHRHHRRHSNRMKDGGIGGGKAGEGMTGNGNGVRYMSPLSRGAVPLREEDHDYYQQLLQEGKSGRDGEEGLGEDDDDEEMDRRHGKLSSSEEGHHHHHHGHHHRPRASDPAPPSGTRSPLETTAASSSCTNTTTMTSSAEDVKAQRGRNPSHDATEHNGERRRDTAEETESPHKGVEGGTSMEKHLDGTTSWGSNGKEEEGDGSPTQAEHKNRHSKTERTHRHSSSKKRKMEKRRQNTSRHAHGTEEADTVDQEYSPTSGMSRRGIGKGKGRAGTGEGSRKEGLDIGIIVLNPSNTPRVIIPARNKDFTEALLHPHTLLGRLPTRTPPPPLAFPPLPASLPVTSGPSSSVVSQFFPDAPPLEPTTNTTEEEEGMAVQGAEGCSAALKSSSVIRGERLSFPTAFPTRTTTTTEEEEREKERSYPSLTASTRTIPPLPEDASARKEDEVEKKEVPPSVDRTDPPSEKTSVCEVSLHRRDREEGQRARAEDNGSESSSVVNKPGTTAIQDGTTTNSAPPPPPPGYHHSSSSSMVLSIPQIVAEFDFLEGEVGGEDEHLEEEMEKSSTSMKGMRRERKASATEVEEKDGWREVTPPLPPNKDTENVARGRPDEREEKDMGGDWKSTEDGSAGSEEGLSNMRRVYPSSVNDDAGNERSNSPYQRYPLQAPIPTSLQDLDAFIEEFRQFVKYTKKLEKKVQRLEGVIQELKGESKAQN